jgi:hypothetical protein
VPGGLLDQVQQHAAERVAPPVEETGEGIPLGWLPPLTAAIAGEVPVVFPCRPDALLFIVVELNT